MKASKKLNNRLEKLNKETIDIINSLSKEIKIVEFGDTTLSHTFPDLTMDNLIGDKVSMNNPFGEMSFFTLQDLNTLDLLFILESIENAK
jgi:hypothetical protein